MRRECVLHSSFLFSGLFGWPSLFSLSLADPVPLTEVKIPLIFTGGHDTDPRDRGRPVVLVAAGLGVPPAVFREAFRHVHPAPAGEPPRPEDVRRNKDELLSRLAPYGVTNDLLDAVSNYYRYRRESGELWRHVDAAGYAVVAGNKVVAIVITNPGAGYSSAPLVTVRTGVTDYLIAVVAFGPNLSTNGSISRIDSSPLGDREIGQAWNVPRSGIDHVHIEMSPAPTPPPPAPPR